MQTFSAPITTISSWLVLLYCKKVSLTNHQVTTSQIYIIFNERPKVSSSLWNWWIWHLSSNRKFGSFISGNFHSCKLPVLQMWFFLVWNSNWEWELSALGIGYLRTRDFGLLELLFFEIGSMWSFGPLDPSTRQALGF